MINNNIAGGNWQEIKGKIQSAWGKLTDDEVETAKGDVHSLTGLIQKRYGTAQEEIRSKLNEWLGKDTAASPTQENLDKQSRRPA